jgi:hypothetical protein
MHVSAATVVNAMVQDAADGTSALHGSIDRLTAINSAVSELDITFPEPTAPSTASQTFCGFLEPIRTILTLTRADPASKADEIDAALAAISALTGDASICSAQFVAGEAIQVLEDSKTVSFGVSILITDSWNSGNQYKFGAGSLMTPETFPEIKADRVMFQYSQTSALYSLDINADSDEVNLKQHVGLTSLVSFGLSISLTIFPGQDEFSTFIHNVFPDATELDFSGDIRQDSVDSPIVWILEARMPSGSIGDLDGRVQLSNIDIKLESIDPHLTMGTRVTITEDENSYVFDANGVFEDFSNLQITGTSEGVWHFDICATGLDVSSLSLALTISHPDSATTTAWSLAVGGKLHIGTTLITASIVSSNTDPLRIEVTVTEDSALTLGNVIDLSTEGRSIDGAAAELFDPLLDTTAFVGASLIVDVGLRRLDFNGRMLLFDGEADFVVSISQTTQADDSKTWSFVVGASWENDLVFSKFVPGVTALDGLQFGPPALVVSSYQTTITFSFPERTENPTATYNVGPFYFLTLVF